MKALDVISAFDNLRPNTFDIDIKRAWLCAVESNIRSFTMLHTDRKPDMSFFREDNPTLYLDQTYKDLYIYYLIAMADMANGEYRLYNISSTYFNSLLDMWKRTYRVENIPEKNIQIKL